MYAYWCDLQGLPLYCGMPMRDLLRVSLSLGSLVQHALMYACACMCIHVCMPHTCTLYRFPSCLRGRLRPVLKDRWHLYL